MKNIIMNWPVWIPYKWERRKNPTKCLLPEIQILGDVSEVLPTSNLRLLLILVKT